VLRGVGRAGSLGVLATVGTAGCLGDGSLSVLAAGSLALAVGEGVGPAFRRETGTEVRSEFHGSAAVLRFVDEGVKRPDVVISADADLLRRTLRPEITDWDVTVAANALCLTAAPESTVAARLRAGEPWYDVLADATGPVARSDPDVDPLGYRTLHAFDLAADYYDEPWIPETLRRKTVVDPQEAHLLAGVETGERVAAACYRNMAVERDLPVFELPPELNFADPARAEQYARASYTLPDGTVVRGSPVVYAATVPSNAESPATGREFVRFLLTAADRLREYGLTVPGSVPRRSGRVPPEVVP
jgi:molybdate/tungstate transport system substrate-binding protein